jgi:hypothetical protein
MKMDYTGVTLPNNQVERQISVNQEPDPEYDTGCPLVSPSVAPAREARRRSFFDPRQPCGRAACGKRCH